MAWVAGGLWVGDYIFEKRLKEINAEIEEIDAVRRCDHLLSVWVRLASRLCGHTGETADGMQLVAGAEQW